MGRPAAKMGKTTCFSHAAPTAARDTIGCEHSLDASSARTMTARLHVPAIGGAHQFAHFLPVAFELAASAACDVRIFAPSPADACEVEALAARLGRARPDIVVMDLPPAVAAMIPGALRKIARLLAWTPRLRDADAILCAERTSTILRRLPGRCPPLIHIPHGAGDRAVGFEDRFRFFDRVIVAGAKDRDRLIREGCVAAGNCSVGGPVKLAAMLRSGTDRPRLFAGKRPVILYNPHFHRRMGSGRTMARRLVETVCADDRYDLVIAPHVRLGQDLSPAARAKWESLAVPGRVLVDLGSPRSSDMSYTLAADLYIGDVSSQVYEYLVCPRPCLFVNGHGADWRGNPDYAMWRFGPVIEPVDDLGAALDHAFASWPAFREAQMARTQTAFDGIDWDAAGQVIFHGADPVERAAAIVARELVQGSAPAWTPADAEAPAPLGS